MRTPEKQEDRSGSVLVVDDDPQIAELIALILSSSGYSASKAASAEEALRRLDSSRVELLIVDVNLPGMGGMEFLKLLRRDYPQLEAIIVSGDSQLEDAVSFVRAGAFDFLPKPISNARLLEKVKAALEYRRERLDMDLAKTAQFMVEERPLAKYVMVKNLAQSPLCEVSLLEKDCDSFILRSYRRLGEMSPRPEELAASFLAIVQRCQALDHSNIAKIHEFGFQESGDRPYVVLERLFGRSLAEELKEGLDIQCRLKIARQVAAAMTRLHEGSLFLGAISLKHIFVEDGSYNAKLIDFGLSGLFGFEARRLDKSLSPDTAFMAPELKSGEKDVPDLKSDVYSLGAFVYAMLLSVDYYPAAESKPRRPENRELAPKTNLALSLLLGAMLQPDPEDRICSDEALSSLNVACTMPDMLDLLISNYDSPANRAIFHSLT